MSHSVRKFSLVIFASLALTGVSSGARADGEAVYQGGCAACHDQGVAGAPKLGDAAAWKDRITQEKEVLYENAINGFQGSAGVMPPKGGFVNLSDEEVKAAVDYMVDSASG